MPAKNPRLTITMHPHLHALFRRLSELTGQSQSALVGELLDGSQNQLSRVIRLLEASNDAKESLRGSLAADLANAQDRIESQLELVLKPEDADYGFSIIAEVEQVRHRLRPGGGGRVRTPSDGSPASPKPPLSNRGVRSLTNAIENIAAKPDTSKQKPKKRHPKGTGVGS